MLDVAGASSGALVVLLGVLSLTTVNGGSAVASYTGVPGPTTRVKVGCHRHAGVFGAGADRSWWGAACIGAAGGGC